MNIYWASAVSMVFFVAIGLVAAKWFHLEGPTWYFFMALMGMLGLTASAFFYYFQEKFKAKREAKAGGAQAAGGAGAAGAAAGDGDAARWVREANSRLAQSKAGVGIENLPMIFVVGDRGTAKTSVLLHSGFEPELLAGQVYQENVVAPTRGANIFYGHDTVFVEAGGTLLANPGAWKNLVVKLRPGRLKSLVGGGGQAPRGVLLCFDLETFSRRGASDSIAAAARYLQERLGDVSEALGISFPVYVLFTRADRLPFFTEFVRNLTQDEVGQVVGVTLPMRGAAGGGVYAEGETQRLTAAFNQLFHSFCDQRLRLLPRESDQQSVPAAYEFPREFNKLRQLLVQFLVDVARPSQLRASPFLRGFYFSGVRPVQMQEAPASPLVQPTPHAEADPVGGGATRMFRAGFQAEQRAQQAQSPQLSAGRKVPQWLFLGHLFHDVILADGAARAASGSSVKTSMAKRVLLGIAAALCLLFSGLLAISFFGNRSLEQTALTAANNIGPGQVVGAAIPTEDSLRKLDSLGKSLQEITEYETNGKPLHLRWGLYAGSDMLPFVRRIYYSKFRQLLFGGVQDDMLAFLQRTPAAPGPSDDYGAGYDTLKGYLLTTSEWPRSKDQPMQAFLASRLLARWSAGRDAQIGNERIALAKSQFDFYAQDLQHGNPYSASGDPAAVERGRIYLSKFTGVERVYQFLRSEASKGHDPTTFNKEFAGSSEVVASTVPVSWAFTRDGWKFIQDQIRKQNFSGEAWVLGTYAGQGQDKAAMEKGILDLYTRDYVKQWRDVMNQSNVRPYANYADAASKLDILTGANAPLLALFWWTSTNTNLAELPAVSEKFRAVQAVIPPSEQRVYNVPTVQNYRGGLSDLQQKVAHVAAKEPDAERAMRESVDVARRARKDLASTLPPDVDAHLERRADDLLEQPIKNLDGLAGGDLRSGGKAFCDAFDPLTKKFPFVPSSQTEVSLAELANILQPGSGKLWTFYDMQLKNVMMCQNGQCQPSGATPLNPNFVTFISQMMQFSRAVYPESSPNPSFRYSLRPQTSDQVVAYDVVVNGDRTELKGGASKAYTWPGPGTPSFQLSLRLPGGGVPIDNNYDKLWAVFRFFAYADSSNATGSGYTFTWNPRSGRDQQPQRVLGKPLTYSIFVDTFGAPAVFRQEFLSKLKCVGPLAR